ncbi:hypothetical protein [Caulobacter sp. RHG1]|uniref:hypothetical protein n=1 Tax=Caulobacter sp. (strain RHG1) TaxID=2545762 RepID=UPI00155183B2|nr:hypothetical protein [Caulobacter sp. RHG1]NQE64688.1 hypothetical protein [Caulobacter sp. RHG1]
MKLAILLAAAIVALFAGLANLWFGDVTLGAALIAAFCAVAGISAWNAKRDYDTRPVEPPVMEHAVD